MTDEALARALAAAWFGKPERDEYVALKTSLDLDRWLRVAAMARTILALEKP